MKVKRFKPGDLIVATAKTCLWPKPHDLEDDEPTWIKVLTTALVVHVAAGKYVAPSNQLVVYAIVGGRMGWINMFHFAPAGARC